MTTAPDISGVAGEVWDAIEHAIKFPRRGVPWEAAPGIERALTLQISHVACRAILDQLAHLELEPGGLSVGKAAAEGLGGFASGWREQLRHIAARLDEDTA